MEIKKEKQEPLKTIIVLMLALGVVFFLTDKKEVLYIAFLIGLAGLFSSYLTAKIDFLWLKFAWLLNMIVPKIILTLVFYFVLTPLAFLQRLLENKDILNLRNTNNSMFKDNNKAFDKRMLEKPW